MECGKPVPHAADHNVISFATRPASRIRYAPPARKRLDIVNLSDTQIETFDEQGGARFGQQCSAEERKSVTGRPPMH